MSADLTIENAADSHWLSSRPALLTLFGGVAAFSAYFCMYAFRKPFSAGTYESLYFAGTEIELKTALVTSQLIGYITSKFIGIKICSETTRRRRGMTLVALILWAEIALVLFAVVPSTWKVVALFLNGLSLGMVWGLVVRYLEGRLVSDPMLAALCCSFILASGYVKSAGLKLMEMFHFSEFWMPSATGLVFLVPFFIAVWMLERLPEPTHEDQAERVRREPMYRTHRIEFFVRFLWGMVMLLGLYFFLTAYRSFRDDFAVEILTIAGITNIADTLAWTETWVAFLVMSVMGALFLVRGKRTGLAAMFGVMLLGAIVLAGGTMLYDQGRISGLNWMILTGLGGYLIYVPYNAVLFDRLIAHTGVVGTAVFAIYLADFIGYTSTIPLMLSKDLVFAEMTRLDFFRQFTYWVSAISFVLLVGSYCYFASYHRPASDGDDKVAAKAPT